MADDTILIFNAGKDEFGLLDEKRSVSLPAADLRKNLEAFVLTLGDILPKAENQTPGMGLKTVSVAVGVNGKGQVGFLGTGAEIGGSATLTLTFEVK